MVDLIVLVIGVIVLIIGSYTDFKTREVPDWVSYGLVIVGFFVSLGFSLFYMDWSYIINSIVGFGVFFIFAMLMFYTGQWGGGDSKVIMGLGALVGMEFSFFRDLGINIWSLFSGGELRALESQFLISFLVNILLVGAVYGLIWSLYLVMKNFKKFFREFSKGVNKARKVQRNVLIGLGVLLVVSMSVVDVRLRLSLVGIIVVMGLTFYLWIFIKSVENVCMIKFVEPAELTEGDWIAKEVKVNGEYICGPKDLGIEKKQIRKLVRFYKMKKVKKILIKEGIPFIPSFLVAFVVTIIYGNVLLLFI